MNSFPADARDSKYARHDVREHRRVLVEEVDVRLPSGSDEFRREKMKGFIANIGMRHGPCDEQRRHGSENCDRDNTASADLAQTRNPNSESIARRPTPVICRERVPRCRLTHFFSSASVSSAAPNAPPMCARRSLQSKQANAN